MKRPKAHHFVESSANGGLKLEFQQLSGPIVGEENSLVGIERDDSFDHAAQDGPQLPAILLDLGKLGG